ncbi:hypothetical protein HJG60_010636 [Phyllostomus discolor]|uniref:Uncharacterized protein n=1 Tax=Phyllostomus discolor TaxID=89673 RepID=A0A834EF93_9CHIR|nr:hypothetical protein HJG60_010636 [Phyllostomus discolor]
MQRPQAQFCLQAFRGFSFLPPPQASRATSCLPPALQTILQHSQTDSFKIYSWQASSTPPDNSPGCRSFATCLDQTLPPPRRSRIARPPPHPGAALGCPQHSRLLSFSQNPSQRHVCRGLVQHPLPTPASDSRDLSAWRPPDAEFPWAPPGPSSGPSQPQAAPACSGDAAVQETRALTPLESAQRAAAAAWPRTQFSGLFSSPPLFRLYHDGGANADPLRSEISRGYEAAPTRRILEPRAQTDLGAGLGGSLVPCFPSRRQWHCCK